MSYASEFIHNPEKSFYTYVEPKSADYRVFVNGEEVSVYTCRISKYPFNTPWPEHQRPISQTVEASYVNLVSEETLHIRVVTERKYSRVMLKPYSKEIPVTENSGEICFDVKPGDKLVLELDSYMHCLYLFCTKPIECENPDEVTYYFGPGIHFADRITLKSGESIYAHKDALVYGCIYAEDAENIRIYGNGVFDDSREERIYEHCYADFTTGNIKLYECKNVKLEGVLFKNSAIWCINLFACSDVDMDNVKVFGQWRYNTDGVDIVNCHDITLRNSFIHSFDDTVTIKGIHRYKHIDCERILIDNCVLWCDWGKCCEIGIETACKYYKDITFRNCDVLRGGHAAIDVSNGYYAEISDITFEDIRVEYNSFDTPPQRQRAEDEVYEHENEITTSDLILVRNKRFGASPDPTRIDGVKCASIHDITIKNIRAYIDKDIPKVDGKYNAPINIDNTIEYAQIYGITVENVEINGEKLTKDTAILNLNGVKESHILD